MLGPNLGKADQHVTNTAYADIKAICVMCLPHLAPSGPNMQTQYSSAKRQQETQVFVWFSVARSYSVPFSQWFAGGDTTRVSQPNLDQLQTQELSKEHVHDASSLILSFIISSDLFYLFCLMPSNKNMCHGPLGKLSLDQCTLGGLPYSPPASPWNGPLGKVWMLAYLAAPAKPGPLPRQVLWAQRAR